MIWLKEAKPIEGPGDPPHCDYEAVMSAIERSRAVGVESPAMAYLWVSSPAQQTDQWNMPVPLSDLDQFNFDRLIAILCVPFERGQALLHSGQLAPDESEALEVVFPDIYAVMVQQATNDMIKHPPPYPDWAEEVLGILFKKPASAVYTGATSAESSGAMESNSGRTKSVDLPTQAERREVGVRAEAR